MAVVKVHSETVSWPGTAFYTPAVTPTPGNLLILAGAVRNEGLGPSSLTGWTLVNPGGYQSASAFGGVRDFVMFYRFAQAGDATFSVGAPGGVLMYAEFSGVGSFLTSVGHIASENGADTICGGAITTGVAALIIGACSIAFINDTAVWSGAPTSGNTEIADKNGDAGSPGFWMGYRVEPAAGTFTVGATGTGTGGTFGIAGSTAAFRVIDIEASFSADPEFGDAPLTVAFTDTSTGGTASAWDWDFGDGGTSTSQNPTHIFTEHGSYTVTLTVTIDGVDYSVSHIVDVTVDVGYTPPLPGLALVEIYATSPGAPRWDIANWDEAVWSSDRWQSVTPESTDVTIIWGSQRPELGILSTPDAASWGIGFFDPLRLLDPANPSSPYFGDIVPGLPVRITHRGWVVKQGVLESAGHNFDLNSFQSHHAGYFRVTDSQSLMARAKVPSDTTLADDLIGRARDAIAAAGLTITVRTHVESPGGIEHALVAWEAGTDWSVWQWISDAAAQVLHIPFINRTGELEFREWAKPRDFGKGRDVGKSLASPNLVGLGSVIFVNGTYSVVTVLDEDGVTVRTAEITPKPYYGAVTYDGRLTLPTPNAQDWAQTVLDDRAVAGLRWVPGEVFPLTANDVRYFAEIEPVERVSIDYPEASPQISATGIVVGGQIVISPVQEREARWSFLFQVAATEDQPLVDDDDASFYLVNDDDPFDYLYPG